MGPVGDQDPTEDGVAIGDATNADDWASSSSNPPESDQWSSAGRGSIDEMARTLSTFGTRLDALVTSTTSYRAAITDRLVEYADMVSRLVKNQSADLAEHRSSNQHLLAELQSGIASSESAVNSLASRVDDLLGSATGDASHEVLSEIRSILDAQERLGQFLTDALDQFGDRVVERLDLLDAADGAEDLSAALVAAQRTDAEISEALKSLSSQVTAVRDDLVDLASGEVVGALWDEVRALRAVVDELADRRPVAETSQWGSGAVDDVRRDIADLRSDLSEGLVVEADESLSGYLEEIRSRLTGIETGSGEVADGGGASSDSQAGGFEPGVELVQEIGRLRDDVAAVAARLEAGLEIDIADDDVADRVAALRDEVTAELEAMRVLLVDKADPAGSARGVADEVRAAVDSSLDGLPEAVADALRSELVALRRRIKVRAEADVLTDDQLDRIAEAVADRLG